jgi:hypothetical protein
MVEGPYLFKSPLTILKDRCAMYMLLVLPFVVSVSDVQMPLAIRLPEWQAAWQSALLRSEAGSLLRCARGKESVGSGLQCAAIDLLRRCG